MPGYINLTRVNTGSYVNKLNLEIKEGVQMPTKYTDTLGIYKIYLIMDFRRSQIDTNDT